MSTISTTGVPVGSIYTVYASTSAGAAWSFASGGNILVGTSMTNFYLVKNQSALLTLTTDGWIVAPQFSGPTPLFSITDDSTSANVVIGANTQNAAASGSSYQNVIIGTDAGENAGGSNYQVLIGWQAGANSCCGQTNTIIGAHAGINMVTGTANTFLGAEAGTPITGTGNIIIGVDAAVNFPAGTKNTFVAGSSTDSAQITDVYFGNGLAAAPQVYTIHGSGGYGSNIAGADIQIAGGTGTGSAVNGNITFYGGAAGTSGSTPNTLSSIASINGTTGAASFNGTLSAVLASSTSALNYACYNSSTHAFTYDSSGTCLASLEEFKDIIGDISADEALALTMKIKPIWAKYKDSQTGVDDHRVHPMLGAHQVESVDPRLVAYDHDGNLHGVPYDKLAVLLIADVQEQQKQIRLLWTSFFVLASLFVFYAIVQKKTSR